MNQDDEATIVVKLLHVKAIGEVLALASEKMEILLSTNAIASFGCLLEELAEDAIGIMDAPPKPQGAA